MTDLFSFQEEAAASLAERFETYHRDPLARTPTKLVPFYQNLSAVTGGGKTIILAEAVERIRERLPVEPIVLWVSKGRVVVWQTFHALATGKYAGIISGAVLKPLDEVSKADIQDASRPLVLVATVGKFNQKDKEEGDRRIFRIHLDTADQSLWNMLKDRRDEAGRQRPLLIVYDEGHNLADQQVDLLLEQGPHALIAASATVIIPKKLEGPVIGRLRGEKGWTNEDFTVSVPTGDVVRSGLIKKQVMLGGYVTPMEAAIDDLLTDMQAAKGDAAELRLPFAPKAIYVSNTNAVDGVSIKEDVARPFTDRQARPILIWQHLVNRGIDPSDIAVYCDLKFDKKSPPPKGFNLFAGGDKDYERFVSGNYKHIIFNLGLQEGWDDPACSFAYIDKDMGSATQITQTVGRVLRQPGAQHYERGSLNTAHFYIRTDEKGIFEAVLSDVRQKIIGERGGIELTVRKTTKAGERTYLDPRKDRTLPAVSVRSKSAMDPIRRVFESIVKADAESAVGKGTHVRVLQNVGSNEAPFEEWVETEHSNRVTARAIFIRELRRIFPGASGRKFDPANLCDIEHPKLDIMVEHNSPAARHLREKASEIVDKYIEHSVIVQLADDVPKAVDRVPVTGEIVKFRHALHDGYSGLNEFELEFARALDRTQRVWCRNPSVGGFSIPLLDRGKTRTFNPDFIAWVDKLIVTIDTKGKHLIQEDATRKLFQIEKIGDGPDLVVRMVTKGLQTITPTGQIGPLKKTGFTVWVCRQGQIKPIHCEDLAETLQACLQTEKTLGLVGA